MTRLNWGMIGGGEGSQIGPAHRISAASMGFTACQRAPSTSIRRRAATMRSASASRRTRLWQLAGDAGGREGPPDRVDLVTVATPNSTHYAITKAFLEAGINVLCEKPMTVTVEEAEDIAATAQRTGAICAVNYGYTGYALVRHMRAMVARGDLGKVRLIVVEFSHGFHADAADADNPRMRWRYDPAQAGISGQFADCGIHALHMASYVCGGECARTVRRFRLGASPAASSRTMPWSMCAWMAAPPCGCGRVRWRSAASMASTSASSAKRAALRWAQQWPDQLYWTPLNGRTEMIERGSADSPEADRATRIATGHSEGMLVAFANIYADLAEVIRARQAGRAPDPISCHYPTAVDGLRSIAAIRAAVSSAAQGGSWTDARPPSLQGS